MPPGLLASFARYEVAIAVRPTVPCWGILDVHTLVPALHPERAAPILALALAARLAGLSRGGAE